MAGQAGLSPFVITCDHAGRRLPRALGALGLSPAALRSHIAWDIGAEAVARRLGMLLDALVVWQPYSRLVIDCNRPLVAPDSIVTTSEQILVPGNQDLDQTAAQLRAREIFVPYHDLIEGELDRRERLGRSNAFVAIHSFTPIFEGVSRPWHAGVLFNRDARLADVLLPALRSERGLVIGENQPYAASAISDYSIVHHGEDRGIPTVELEIRQDLIGDQDGQEAWAQRLARIFSTTAKVVST